jgi:hypothetical protein
MAPPTPRRPHPSRRLFLKIGTAGWLAGWAAFGLPWGSVSLSKRRRPILAPFRRGSYKRSDLVLNFVYYVPVGLFGELRGQSWVTTVGIAAGLSALTETIQMFSRNRYPSVSDLILNTLGAIAGFTLAKIVIRSRSLRSAHPD